jgi:hypothetical protein
MLWGTQIHDYEEHFYDLSVGKTVLAGIRHKSGSKNQPFVHTLLDFVPTNADMDSLKEFATEQFRKFTPNFLSIWLRPSLQLDVSNYNATQSRQYMAGLIDVYQINFCITYLSTVFWLDLSEHRMSLCLECLRFI